MSSSLILKKAQHWYIIGMTDNCEALIRSLISKHEPDIGDAYGELETLLAASGWVIEEYTDLADVA